MKNFSDDDYISLIRLSKIEGIGVNKLRIIVSAFSSAVDVFTASIDELISIDGISQVTAKKIILESERKEFLSFAENQIIQSQKFHSKLISFWDEDYPYILRKIYDPPVLLFQKGNFDKKDENSIAVVGTRNPTNYGRQYAEVITTDLVKQNVTIVSGLARGIDTIAHQTVIKNQGRTIAILGSGLDVIYPPENKKLYQEIITHGCILSEYAFGTKPDPMNFPKRNRIISGLSLGTLVIETDVNGGAMITANYAFDQNREVFALPGNVGMKQSKGTNQLIKRNEAKLITSAEDILNEFGNRFALKEKKPISIPSDLNIFESQILSAINDESIHIDEIAEKTGLQTSDCLVHLLSLEFKGLVKQLPGKLFSKFY